MGPVNIKFPKKVNQKISFFVPLPPTTKFCFWLCRCTSNAGDVAAVFPLSHVLQAGKRSFTGGSAKILSLPFPHRLFDLKSNLVKKFCPFLDVD